MEKKDWKDRLREFPFIKMYLLKKFKANNPREQGMADILTLVKDKEFYDLIDFISKELDKAREEGRKEGLVENLDKRNSEGGLTILESLMVSKLKTKEDGK